MQENNTHKKPVKRTVLWTVIAVVLVLVAGIAGGTEGTMDSIGVIGLVTAGYALFAKKPSWLNLRSRRSIVVVFVISLLLLFVPGPSKSVLEVTDDVSTSSQAPDTDNTEEKQPEAIDPGVDKPAVDESESEQTEPNESDAEDPESDQPAPSDPGTDVSNDDEPAAYEPVDQSTATPGTALEALEDLEVKGRAPKTDYDRKKQFGNPWTDVEYNGCDTRNDILKRDLINIETDDRCRVLTGTLIDRYSGEEISFVRGQYSSAEVQIDHVVALSDAWQKGAQNMTKEQRVVFANDPINLFAVSGSLNAQKSDKDAASWLPPHKPFRCEFVATQVSVKAAYDLWVTKAEKAAMKGILENCDDQPLTESTYKELMQASS